MSANPPLEIRLLGSFEVAVGGRLINRAGWPSRRSAELVQLLALADGHQLARDQVMEALWPHLSPKAAAANLRKAAHHARRAIGVDASVVLERGMVCLAPFGSVATDLAGFEEAARSALEGSDVDAARLAVDLYGGELLPGSLYEEWTQEARRHARALYLDLLHFSDSWERIVEVDPSSEVAYRELMKREFAAGNRPEAIRWYGRLRSYLASSLGLSPGPETEAIYRVRPRSWGVRSSWVKLRHRSSRRIGNRSGPWS
jgi:DNA-binding SARP family transcriptional activator